MASDGFRPLDEKLLVEYVKATPVLADKLGNQFDKLEIEEVGDGNLNFVYIVISPSGSCVIKQALPYIRCIGESWPMAKERAYFEAITLKEHGGLCPDHVPEVYHFDNSMCLIEHISDYMAKTLFYTSLLYLTTTDHKSAVAKYCGNVEMCRLTEQVVFSDPYKVSEHNHWTSPYLDSDAEAVREDNLLKLEIAELKSKFCERAQALIHGDLHTGSVMVTGDSTQVIDPEFGFYGPMGFDIGAFVGNLILAYFAQDGHAVDGNDRKPYKVWILKTITETWNLFYKKFTALWDEHKDGPGEAYLPAIYNNPDVQLLVKQKYMKELFHDTLGFGAAKMIRRIVGVAHVADFESIKEAKKRAVCERKALNFAKNLLKERRDFQSISEVVSAMEQLDSQ
ncbi:unnamed protein product [Fraxinus pennsylvanica]|uniref:S-methyl-5-thioribose kinase n=1 Tax=Fraxinus pennsylvanica TaxID=56036 RepID=A0AAD1ZCY2_9LAMI|nr:unnamed protein product [Fraxinus pennsylvanica]